MKKDGMSFARVAAPKENKVGFLDLLIRVRTAARTEDRRQTDDAGCVSGAVAAIDIVAADDHPRELLR